MLKGINLSLILDLKQPRKLDLCENCDFNKQITFAILSERPCRVPYDANKVRKDVLVVFQILYRCNICIEKSLERKTRDLQSLSPGMRTITLLVFRMHLVVSHEQKLSQQTKLLEYLSSRDLL